MGEILKNVKVQKQNGYCGLYNMANVLQNKLIVDDYKQDSTIPVTQKQLNDVLHKCNYEFHLTFYIGSYDWKEAIPFSFFEQKIKNLVKKVKKKDINIKYSVPFVLNVQVDDKEETLHSVTLLYHKESYWISDPTETHFTCIGMDLSKLERNYKYINAVYVFEDKDHGLIVLGAFIYD